MYIIRPSTPADIPAIRELWSLAFGDSGAYMDAFLTHCHSLHPERTLVLEEDGVVRSMTTWIDTAFVTPDGTEHPAAYIYAVATHPDARSRGFAAKVLAWAEEHLRSLGYTAMTTVPSEPSLHNYYGSLGFRECFCHDEVRLVPSVSACPLSLEAIPPQTYTQLRETLLQDIPHIRLPVEAATYQAGCSAISGGGLYSVQTPFGAALLCTEGMEDGTLLVKELLGCPKAQEIVKNSLSVILPNFSGICRFPGKTVPFGMLKWLDPQLEANWNWASTAYLGLAFD